MRGTHSLRRALFGLAVVAVSLAVGAPAGAASAYSPTALPGSTGSTSTQYSDIDCWSAGNCVAVGWTSSSGSSSTSQVVVQETGGVWGTPTSPYPVAAGTGYGRLDAVSCPAPGSCVAVGRYGGDGGATGALIATLSGGTWTAIPGTTVSVSSSTLPDAYNAELVDVSCSSATSCAAVGTYEDTNPPVRGLLDVLSGTTWTPSSAVVPQVHGSDPSDTELDTVSCTAAAVCVGVGHSDSGGYEAGVIERLSGSTWADTAAPEPSGGSGNHGTLTAVSCGSTGRCAAVGTYTIYNPSTHVTTTAGMIDSSDSGLGWAAAAAPVPAGTNTVTPQAVSCVGDSDDTCAVAGFTTGNSIDPNNLYPVVITATSTSTWTALPVALPADALPTTYIQMASLPTISCTGSSSCVAAGSYYNDSSSGRSGLIVTVSPSAGTATSETAPLPADAAVPGNQDVMYSASRCLDASHCALLATYTTSGAVEGVGNVVDSSGAAVTPPATPTVSSLSPKAGSTKGGGTVTITGTHLTGTSKVTFGSTAATHLVVVSKTEVQVTAPAHASGKVDVTVTTAGGTSAATSADKYTYQSAPTVTSISPAKGSHKGGTKVTVHGTGFTGKVTVKFGSASGTSVSVTSSKTLTVKAPKHAKGAVHVLVTTPGGTSASTARNKFTYS